MADHLHRFSLDWACHPNLDLRWHGFSGGVATCLLRTARLLIRDEVMVCLDQPGRRDP